MGAAGFTVATNGVVASCGAACFSFFASGAGFDAGWAISSIGGCAGGASTFGGAGVGATKAGVDRCAVVFPSEAVALGARCEPKAVPDAMPRIRIAAAQMYAVCGLMERNASDTSRVLSEAGPESPSAITDAGIEPEPSAAAFAAAKAASGEGGAEEGNGGAGGATKNGEDWLTIGASSEPFGGVKSGGSDSTSTEIEGSGSRISMKRGRVGVVSNMRDCGAMNDGGAANAIGVAIETHEGVRAGADAIGAVWVSSRRPGSRSVSSAGRD